MRRTAAALALVAALAGCGGGGGDPTRPHPLPSSVEFRTDSGAASLSVQLATTEADRRRGLQGVETLPPSQGMAFVFDEPVSASFWMKDTLIPLSIAFVDQGGEVIGIREMEPCEADPCPTYGVDRPFVLAIEANRGWFRRAGVEVGDRATLRVMNYG
jgi:uncharacterized membrane protein (UPF0127 family)